MLIRMLCLFAVAGLVCFAAIHGRYSASTPNSHPAAGSTPASSSGERTDVLAQSRSSSSKAYPALAPATERQAQLIVEIQNQLASGDETARERVLAQLLPQLVALNPAAAGRLAEAIGPDVSRADILRSVAQAWAATDPAGALAWAAQLSDPDEQRTTLMNVVLQMAQKDPAQAVNAAQQYSLNAGSYDVLPSLAVQWASQDLTAAMAWADNLPAGDQRNEIMSRIAFVEAQSAPANAGAFVLAEIPPGPVLEEAVMTVIHQWSLNDMSGALAWARQFPEGSLKDRALAELAVVYNQHNFSGTQ